MDDSTPELNETFAVLLEGVELIGGGSGLQPQLGGVRSAVVTILQNDDAHGLFVIKARDGDNGTFGSRVTVQEPDSDVPVYFVLERQGGTLGRLAEFPLAHRAGAWWAGTGQPAVLFSSDAAQANTG